MMTTMNFHGTGAVASSSCHPLLQQMKDFRIGDVQMIPIVQEESSFITKQALRIFFFG
jgi:hypothetical protein